MSRDLGPRPGPAAGSLPDVDTTALRSRVLDRLATGFARDVRDPAAEAPALRFSCEPDPRDRQALLDLAMQRFESQRFGYHVISDRRQLFDDLANRVFAGGHRNVVVAPRGRLEAWHLVEKLRERLPGVEVVSAGSRDAANLATFHVAVTPVAAVLAQTGCVVITGRTASELAVSLLPRIHFCVATAGDLLPDLAAYLARPGFDPALTHVVIGGPSRTADIEKQIVYGIHGPWSAMLFHLANEE